MYLMTTVYSHRHSVPDDTCLLTQTQCTRQNLSAYTGSHSVPDGTCLLTQTDTVYLMTETWNGGVISWQTDRQIDWQTDRQADRQTNRPTDRQRRRDSPHHQQLRCYGSRWADWWSGRLRPVWKSMHTAVTTSCKVNKHMEKIAFNMQTFFSSYKNWTKIWILHFK